MSPPLSYVARRVHSTALQSPSGIEWLFCLLSFFHMIYLDRFQNPLSLFT